MEAHCFKFLVVEVLKGMRTNSSIALLGSPGPCNVTCDIWLHLTCNTETCFRKHLDSQQLLKIQIQHKMKPTTNQTTKQGKPKPSRNAGLIPSKGDTHLETWHLTRANTWGKGHLVVLSVLIRSNQVAHCNLIFLWGFCIQNMPHHLLGEMFMHHEAAWNRDNRGQDNVLI